MKRIDRTLLAEMIAPFLAGTLGFVAIILANVIVKSSETIFQLNAPWQTTAQWLGLRVPVILTLALPVGSMLATSLVIIRLGRDNEITAWRMGGVSIRRLFVPFYLIGVVVSVFALLNNELVAPDFARRSNRILLGTILQQGGSLIKNNATFRAGGESFAHVGRVDIEREAMERVLIYRFEQGRLRETLSAPRAERAADGWVLRNGQHHWFDDAGHLQRMEPFEEHPLALASNITDLWEQDKDPQEMTIEELRERRRLYAIAGDALNEIRMRYFYHLRFALPLTSLIFTLLAAPLSLRFANPRSNPFAGVLLTIVVVFFANGTINWARTIALSGPAAWIPPGIAAWLHVLIFGGLALVLLRTSERVGR